MRTCVLLRHLPTVDDLANRITGQDSSLYPARGLSPSARETMQQVVERLHVNTIYTADNLRSRQTVTELALNKILPVYADPRLRNIFIPEWVGKTEDELTGTPEWHQFFGNPLSFTSKTGESMMDVVNRVDDFLQSLPESVVPLIVSHTTALQIILFRILLLPINKLWAFEFLHESYSLVQDATLTHFNIPLECLPSIGVPMTQG